MNGGEGPIGNAGYIVLWSIEKSRDFHTHERFNKTSAKYIPIGSNGGGELLVIRYSGNDATFGYMPFIDPSDDNFVVINCDFWKALELIGEGRAFG